MKEPSASLFFALFSVLFLTIFNYTLPALAGVYIVGDLGGSNYITVYSVTFFSVGNALGVILGGGFYQRIGTVRFTIGSLLYLAFFSWMCGFASTYLLFILFRFLQGLVTGPTYVLINRFFSHLVPFEKKELFTSFIVTIFTITPVLATVWGGTIAYLWNWRWIFYINIPFILFLAFFIKRRLEGYDAKYDDRLSYPPFDWVGYLFFFIGILGLSFFFTTGQEFDWFRSSLLVTVFFIGVISLPFSILWTYHHPYPFLDVRLLKNHAFSFSLLFLTILFSAYFGMVFLLGLWLKLYVQYTPIWIGILLGTMAIGGLFPTFLVREKWILTDCRWPLLLAIACLAISSFHTAHFNVDINFGRIAFSRVLAGFGLALFLPPLFRLSFLSFPEEKSIQVMLLFQVVRALSSGLGASFYIILWQRREIFFHERLGSQLTVFSQQTRDFFETAKQFFLYGREASAQLDVFLERQATSLALNDCFYLMGWIFCLLSVIVGVTFLVRTKIFFPEKNRPSL